MRIRIGAGQGLRIGTLAVFGAALALSLTAGCGAPIVTNPEDDLLVGEQIYQRMPGSAPRIFLEAKNVLDNLGFKVVSVRQNAAINARLDSPKRPIHVYLKILGGDRLYIRLYNLQGDEHDEWMTRLFASIRASIVGTPAEREKKGRPRQG
ncbi:MAG: hypothetical protein ACYTKD_11805 [Planctomycetota bacterium]